MKMIFVLMLQNKRFKKLCKRFGYKIIPIASKINWKLQKRTDIVGIDYHGDFIMVVPRKMYGFPIRSHRDFNGFQHPDYFTCEATLYGKTYIYGKF